MNDKFTIIDFNQITERDRINLLNYIYRHVIFATRQPLVFIDDFDFSDLSKSEIFNNQNKDYLHDFFAKLFIVLDIHEDDLNFLMSFLVDDNGMPAGMSENFSEVVQKIEAIASLFVQIWLIPINLPRTSNRNEILQNYAEKEMTIGNYIFLMTQKYPRKIKNDNKK